MSLGNTLFLLWMYNGVLQIVREMMYNTKAILFPTRPAIFDFTPFKINTKMAQKAEMKANRTLLGDANHDRKGYRAFQKRDTVSCGTGSDVLLQIKNNYSFDSAGNTIDYLFFYAKE
jgi:hypothetical protein